MILQPETGIGAAEAAPRSEWWNPPDYLLELGSEAVADVLEMFRVDTESRIPKLWDRLSRTDFAGVMSEAHSLKGSAAQIGADAVASCCRQIEAAAREASAPKVDLLLKRLAGEVARVCDKGDLQP